LWAAIRGNRIVGNDTQATHFRMRKNQLNQGRLIMSKTELFEKGLKVRKEVLGEDYVNKSIAGADEFTRTMAEWSTEFCWGALWTRPGLDRRTRSIINLAMLGALGRPHELKLHVKGALKNGLTVEEIKEIFLQVAVYCGVPSGIDAFRNAREALKEVQEGK
jgi:4-carboxymuconolactone decarboxylase